MSGDKRSVSTDALETLGTIIGEGVGRDAIHLAVEPVIAATRLYPGQDVGFVEGGVGPCNMTLGIVDPFLKAPVQKGQRFWLVVYPRQITSLRHVWTHPQFAEVIAKEVESSSKEASEKWLREYCKNDGEAPEYETLIALACGQMDDNDGEYGWSHQGEYLLARGHDAHGDIPAELWDHVENVIGKKIPSEKRASHFSCSC
jgi:hypothetical protein